MAFGVAARAQEKQILLKFLAEYHHVFSLEDREMNLYQHG